LVRLFVQVGDNVVTSNGSYPTFNYHVEGFGGQLFKCDYLDDKEDLQSLIDTAAKTNAKLVYISNPNNPMGTWTRGEQIVSLLDKLPNDSLLVLDEAYAEFAPDEAKVPIFLDDPRMIRFRTFSKAYGVAGARIGYGIGNEELIAEFDKIRNHFGNSLLSQVAAIAAIKDQRYLSEIVKKISFGREEIYQIAQSNGLSAIPSATNFVAIDCGKDGKFANQIMSGLLEAKLFVRKPVVAPLDRTIRVTVGRDEEIDLLKNVLPNVLKALR
jgi:histidinol-phosphate aminotransferase